ncbi:MAG: hypothetical protein OXF79_02875 [Chloroflexi bacterium]|nr:hypothetical protein [Chloroflexota bacterium]
MKPIPVNRNSLPSVEIDGDQTTMVKTMSVSAIGTVAFPDQQGIVVKLQCERYGSYDMAIGLSVAGAHRLARELTQAVKVCLDGENLDEPNN